MWEKLKIMSSSIWSFVLPFLRQLLTTAGSLAAAAALEAVKQVALNAAGATSEEKRNQALQLVVDNLKQKGITVGIDIGQSLVNATIEVALQKLKEA